MDLKSMLAFRTLADELHFSRAAELLGISQPALSQQMQRLESELDSELFVRTSRAVRLTQIGELFLESCRRTLAEADRARATVKDAREGIMGRLVIGCLGAAANGPLPGMVRAFLDEEPRRAVELRHFVDSGEQERALIAETIDVGFVRSIGLVDQVEGIHVLDEPFIVFVPESHPFAGRSRVGLAELRDESMIFWPRSMAPSYYDMIIGGCRRAGFDPRISGYATSLESQLALVAAGLGVTLQSESNGHLSRDGVVTVELDAPDFRTALWLIYPRWHRSRLTDRFIEVAQPLAQSTRSDPGRLRRNLP
jgi:DNA-binding transcriptional LysR family regulator